MKNFIILTQVLSIVLLIFCGVFFYYNGTISVELIRPEIILPLWSLKFGSFIAGLTCGTALCGIYLLRQNDRFTALERRNEKKEIKSDNNEAKIKVLENKIASLEQALKKALGE